MAPPQWAYQVENFVNEPDEEFVCSICRAIFCDPIICPCDHVFCRICITKWLQNNRNCPICRKRVSNSSVKPMVPIIKNLIMKLVLYCRNKTRGCKEQFPLESCEAHMKECLYEFVQCKNKPCKSKLLRKDIAEHENNDCPHRYIKCKKCGSKMLTSVLPENHDCIRALQLRLRRKNNIIRKKNNKIKELKNENKTLKTASQNSRYPLSGASHNFVHPLASSTLTSLSPDEIMINVAELESSSPSPDSDDSSENSIIIFTNSPYHTDYNAELESFRTYMDNEDSVELSQTEHPEDATEFRNAQSQTVDDWSANEQPNEAQYDRNESPSIENVSIAVEAPDSLYDDSEERSQVSKSVKRRPTTQKPAKRRLPPPSPVSSDDVDESQCYPFSIRSSKRCWRLPSTDNGRRVWDGNQLGCLSFMRAGPSSAPVTTGEPTNRNQTACLSSFMRAGPSSTPVTTGEPSKAVSDTSTNTKWRFRSRAKFDQKHTKEKSNGNSGSEILSSNANPTGNAVFERTLALLEQYNLESDPEWLPEYASHRGNDTTTESESSIEADFIDDSSSSDVSDSDSNNEDDSNTNHDSTAVDFMHWMLDSASEDDPDWQPINFHENKRV